MREANAARFKQTCQREFEAFRKERLATGELECQKLITAAQAHLTQVLGSTPLPLEQPSNLFACPMELHKACAAVPEAHHRRPGPPHAGAVSSLRFSHPICGPHHVFHTLHVLTPFGAALDMSPTHCLPASLKACLCSPQSDCRPPLPRQHEFEMFVASAATSLAW